MRDLLTEHGLVLCNGVSALLAIGALVILATRRSPIHRQRICELTVAAAMLWSVLVLLPLPRWSSPLSPISTVPETVRERRSVATHEPVADATNPAVAYPIHRPESFVIPGPAPVERTGNRLANGFVDRLETGFQTGIEWSRLFAGLYLLGAILSVAYLLLGGIVLWRTLKCARCVPAWIDRLCDELREATGLARAPGLYVTRCKSPFCVDLLRSSIVLPEHLCTPERYDQIRNVLLHELAHLRQRDSRGRFLFALALPLLWWHPVYWWIRARARFACEVVADDIAAHWSDKTSYARQLIQLASVPTGGRILTPLAAGVMFSNRTDFYRRIEMLMKRSHRLPTRASKLRVCTQTLVAAVVVAIPATMFGAEPLPAQDWPAQKKKQDPLRTGQQTREALEAEIRRLRTALAELQTRVGDSSSGNASVLVKKGDSLSSIVKRHYGNASALVPVAEYNKRVDPEFDPSRLEVGQRVLLPGARSSRRSTPSSAPGLSPAEDPAVAASRVSQTPATTLIGSKQGVTQPPPGSTWTTSYTADAYILDLLTRAIDLESEIEVAQHELQAAEETLALAGRGATTRTEQIQLRTAISTAKIKMGRATRKRGLVRTLIRAEIVSTEVEITRAKALHKAGIAGSEPQIVRFENRLKILVSAR